MTNSTQTKKVTLATVKSFIKKNINDLYIRMDSRFDGMVDCVMPNSEANFSKVDPTKLDFSKPDFGLEGFWHVGQSSDYFEFFQENNMTGFKVSNCCGSSILAIKKD